MTDLFSFILVMVSLVLAIGVTHLVQGVADIVRRRGTVRVEPLQLAWAAALFLVAALYWWSLWDLRAAEWRFPLFFGMLLAPTLLHIAASLLVSTDGDEAGPGAAFEQIRVPFMVVMALFSVVVMLDGWAVGSETTWWTVYRPIQLWTVGLYGAGAVLGGARAQRAIAGLALATYVAAGFVFRLLPGAFGS
ncbi:hypothetical protein [Rubrivirga sp. IMCC45206]|uniref:hypothetical protein n=1 Tax=Rubrivirga sp. IMCC45206 TaxID=3391614 RepID=UPI0039901F1A